jgi:cytochrome c5
LKEFKEPAMPLGKLASFFVILAVFIGFSPIGYAADSADKDKKSAHEVPYATYPKPNYGTGENRKLIERGEYLAKAGDCIACHTDTKKGTPAFAGGLTFVTPFGILFSPNITPDKDTGIGKWTDEEFVRSMHDGIAPDGSNYYPAFPYTYFNKVSREDILAMKAYLFSIPAVRQENRKNQMQFPFSIRFSLYGWKLLFFQFNKGQFKPDATRTEEWNRGAELVLGLGHCGMCHTPVNMLYAPKEKYAFTGNMTPDGYYAPDISARGLKNSSIEEIVEVFTKDKKLNNGGKVGGPMAEVNHDSLIHLPGSDLRAMAVYLKTVESAEPPKDTSTGGEITPETGKKIYKDKCAVCHDNGSAGAPKTTDKAVWEKIMTQGMDTVLLHAIKGYNSMPAKGACTSCSDEEIKAAVEYMLDESKKATVATSTSPVLTIPKLTLADGKAVYDATCHVCHANGELGSPKLGDKKAWAPRINQGMEVLFTHAIRGYNRMPPKGTDIYRPNAEIEAAVKYMVQQSKSSGDYSLW